MKDIQQILRTRNLDILYEYVLNLLEAGTTYDSASIFQEQKHGEWAISAWRYYEQWIPIRLLHSFRTRIEQDMLFQEAFAGGEIVAITTRQRPLIWRHAQSWLLIPLHIDGECIALISLESLRPDAFSAELIDDLDALRPWLAIAFDNAQQVTSLRESGKVMTHVQEMERDALADVLHDDIADVLSLIKNALLRSHQQLTDSLVATELHQTIQSLSAVTEKARLVSHTLGAKRIIDRFDLLSALEILVDNYTKQTGIDVEFTHRFSSELHLDDTLKLAIYRIIQEALTNTAKYTDVEVVSLKIEVIRQQLVIQIQDEGPGFDLNSHTGGIGLMGMRQRSLLHAGTFNIQSQPGKGTLITVEFPLPAHKAANTKSLDPERVLTNLIAFARLYGYIRYFYPDDSAAYADWEQIALEGVQLVENAEDDAQLQQRLLTLFSPIAPDLEILFAEALPPYQTSTRKDYVTVWRHHGFGVGNPFLHKVIQEDTEGLHAIARLQQGIGIQDDSKASFLSGREFFASDAIPDYVPHPDHPFVSSLSETLVCRFPIALYKQMSHQSYTNVLESLMEIQTHHVDDVQAHGVAAVIILWNVIQHFYPRPLENWDTRLEQGLQFILQERYTPEQALRWLIAHLQDSGARVSVKHIREDDAEHYAPPFSWDYLDDSLVITHVLESEKYGLQVGDTIAAIESVPVEKAIEQAIGFASGNTLDNRRRTALRHLWRGKYGTYLNLDILRDEQYFQVRVQRMVQSKLISEQLETRPNAVIASLENGIEYIDITRVRQQQLSKSIYRLQTARALIVDARGVSHSNSDALELLIAHLIDKPATLMPLAMPRIYVPDRQRIDYILLPKKTIEPHHPYFEMPVVALIDGRTNGRVEHYLHMLQALGRAEFIGYTTAGDIGTNDLFTILDTYDISWTVTTTEMPFNGIAGSIPFRRSLKGIQMRQDEILQQTIEWIGKIP